MQKFKPFFLVIFSGLICYSCNRCENLECVSNNYFGQFRIVRISDGKDLVFGPDKIYDKNQIKFYSLKNSDTIFFEYQTIKFSGAGYDSILYVHFFPKADIAYMRLSNNDIDTLNISYNITNTECCGTITAITNFRFNNMTNIPGGQGTQEIKK